MARRASRVLAVPLVERGYRPNPVYLFLELNRRCNHRCIMCDIWKHPTDGLPLADIERIFSQPFFDNFERVILAGGEPTIRKDLVEVAAFFIERMPRMRAIAILTNGYSTRKTLESVQAILDRMDAAGRGQCLAVQISLDGIGEEYNQIRGIDKAWARTHETVLQLQALAKTRPNLSLMLHVVMQPRNLDQLDTIDGFARELGIPIIFSPAVISDTYFGNASTEHSLEFDDAQKARARDFILKREASYTDAQPFYYQDIANMLQGAQRSRRCMMGYYIMYVRMDGKVFPCINSGDAVLGDLTTQTPELVWRGAVPDQARRTVRSDFCPSCPSACDNDFTSAGELISKLGVKLRKMVQGG
jgi:MoaA/NifB/PqqE/SkfB family radical SAM enzyme